MATHSSVLAWRIPGAGEPGGLPSMGSQSQTRLKRLSSSSSSSRSSLLCRLFSSCGEQGHSGCSAQASLCVGFSGCGAQALGCTGPSSCGSRALEHKLSSCGTRA